MTPQAFANKYIGQQLTDPWGGYKGECVSLWKRYAQEVQGVNPADLYVPGGAAKNIWFQFTSQMAQYYDKVSSPQSGDAAIYDGSLGDVAIVLSPTEVFGQLGTPVFKPASRRSIGSPIGYIRFKGGVMDTFNEGDRVNWNVDVYGQRDRGYHEDMVGKPWKDAIYGILSSAQFKDENKVNKGDLDNYFNFFVGRAPTPADYDYHVGQTHKFSIYDLMSRDDVRARLKGIINRDSAIKYISDNLE